MIGEHKYDGRYMDGYTDLVNNTIDEHFCPDCNSLLMNGACQSVKCRCQKCGELIDRRWDCACTRQSPYYAIHDYWKKAGNP